MSRFALAIAAALLLTAACGKRGELERPPAPIWGPGSPASP